jgi:hypothetical protein
VKTKQTIEPFAIRKFIYRIKKLAGNWRGAAIIDLCREIFPEGVSLEFGLANAYQALKEGQSPESLIDWYSSRLEVVE